MKILIFPKKEIGILRNFEILIQIRDENTRITLSFGLA
jgi:hypothetical protein